MEETIVREAARPDADAIVDALSAALVDDPFVVWLTDARVAKIPDYVRLMVEEVAFPRGLVHVAERDGRVVGAALWAPPRSFALGPWDTVRLMPRMIRIVGWRRMTHVSSTLEEIEAARPPEPYWLLTLLGVVPAFQGLRIGSALLAPVLARADEDGLVVAGETAAKDNLPFYLRHGFVVRAERSLEPSSALSRSLARPAIADRAGESG
ncbi:MAG: GNAT family N-acetyltransferase [Sandaracinaceae bacterium]